MGQPSSRINTQITQQPNDQQPNNQQPNNTIPTPDTPTDHVSSISRVTDVESCPSFLQPIDGWQDAELVSIYKSVETLPIPHVRSAATCASEWAEDFLERNNFTTNLSIDQIAALHLYTTNAIYRVLNSTLLNKDRDQLKPWFLYLKLILSCMRVLPVFTGQVWRGVKGLDLSLNYPVGKKFRWWSFTSSTKSGPVVQSFLGDAGIRTLVSINSLSGVEIEHLSAVPGEVEVLFAPGTRFEVKTVIKPAADLTILALDEIRDNVPYSNATNNITPEEVRSTPAVNIIDNNQGNAPQTTTFNPNNIPVNVPQTTMVNPNNIPVNVPQNTMVNPKNIPVNVPQTTMVNPNNIPMNVPQNTMFNPNNIPMNVPQTTMFNPNNIPMNVPQNTMFNPNNIPVNVPQNTMFNPNNNIPVNVPQNTMFNPNNIPMNVPQTTMVNPNNIKIAQQFSRQSSVSLNNNIPMNTSPVNPNAPVNIPQTSGFPPNNVMQKPQTTMGNPNIPSQQQHQGINMNIPVHEQQPRGINPIYIPPNVPHTAMISPNHIPSNLSQNMVFIPNGPITVMGNPNVLMNKPPSVPQSPTGIVIQNLTGAWKTTDPCAKASFYYYWDHPNGELFFTGYQHPNFKINGIVNPSTDKNKVNIEWTFTDFKIRCYGQLEISKMKITGKYFDGPTLMGEFIGEKLVMPNITGNWKTRDTKTGESFFYYWKHEKEDFRFKGLQNPNHQIIGILQPSTHRNKMDIEWTFIDLKVRCCGQLDISKMKITGKYYDGPTLMGEFIGERTSK